jgi:thiamine monophosphate synthase
VALQRAEEATKSVKFVAVVERLSADATLRAAMEQLRSESAEN